MRRSLGSFETALTLSGDHAPFVVVMVLQLEGGPSPERLRRALDALQERHPPLCVRIVERGRRFAYETDGTPPIPLEVRPRSGDEHWAAVAEEELGRPVDRAAGPLLRCLYLASAEAAAAARSEIVLTFHHAVMDGASGLALAGELHRLLQDRPLPAEAGTAAALPAVETLFPRRCRGLRGAVLRGRFLARQLRDELAFRYRSRARRRPKIVVPARCRVGSFDLPREETAALVRRSRRLRVTLTAALHAAFLLAVQRHLYGGRPGPLRYLAFADLRPHLDPPMDPLQAPAALGSCIAMLRYTVRVDGGAGGAGGADSGAFWPLARQVGQQVDAGVRRGDRFGAVAFSASMMRGILSGRMGRMAATAVSYLGPVRVGAGEAPPGSAAPARVRGVRSFVSNLAEGPEYTAQARLWGGELQLDVVYLEADMDQTLAGAIAESVLDTLRAAGRGEEP